MRYFTPTRRAIHKKTNKYWQGCRETGILISCCWECKTAKQSWKTVWQFLKKFSIKLSYDPSIPLLGLYPGDLRTYLHTKFVHNVHSNNNSKK